MVLTGRIDPRDRFTGNLLHSLQQLLIAFTHYPILPVLIFVPFSKKEVYNVSLGIR